MKNIINFTQSLILQDHHLAWLSEHKTDWVSSVYKPIKNIVEGKTIILITDKEYEWFSRYIKHNINKSNARPLIPAVVMNQLYPFYDEVCATQKINNVDDMLQISFSNNYFFWYIGNSMDLRGDIAKMHNNSCLWFINEENTSIGFNLKVDDENLDVKLLQMYKVFDATLSASLFGEIDEF